MAVEMKAGTVAAYLKIYDQEWSEGLRKANASLANNEVAFKRRFGAIAKSADQAANRMAVAAAAGVAAAGKMVKLAMDAVESENLFTESLKQNADQVRAWSEGLRKELGLNAYEVRKNTGMIYSMLNSMGASEEASLDMSKGISQLAYDMASFYNLKPEETFAKLRSGISGEIEPLRQLGISVDVATAKSYMMRNAIKGNWEELDQASKVAIRYRMILEQTTDAQGDLARTIDSPTNKLRVMQETAKQTAIDLGMALLPAFEKLLAVGGKLTDWLAGMTDEQKKHAAQMLLWTTAGLGMTAVALKLTVGVAELAKAFIYLRTAGLASLGPAVAAVTAIVGVATGAWYLHKLVVQAQYKDIDALIKASKENTEAAEGEVRVLDAQKSRRQALAEATNRLTGEYEALLKKSNRTAAEQGKLESIKKQLTDRMVEIRKELGQQAQAWDGNAKSIRGAISALLDFTEIEQRAFKSRATVEASTARDKTLAARRVRVEQETNYNRLLGEISSLRAGPQRSRGRGGDIRFGTALSTSAQIEIRQKKLSELYPQLEKARREENALFWEMRRQEEILATITGMTPEELEKYRAAAAGGGGGTDTPTPTGAGAKATAAKPEPSLLVRTHQALRDARETAEMLGWDERQLADEFARIYEGALTELARRIDKPREHPAFAELSSGFGNWSKISADLKAAAEAEDKAKRALEEQLAGHRAKSALIVEDAKWGEITREQAIEALRAQQASLGFLRDETREKQEYRGIEQQILNLQAETAREQKEALEKSAAAAKEMAAAQERARAAAAKHVELLAQLARVQARGNLEAEADVAEATVARMEEALATALAFERANPGQDSANAVAQARIDLEEARQAYQAAVDRLMAAEQAARERAGAGYIPGVGFFNVEQPAAGDELSPIEGPYANTGIRGMKNFGAAIWNFTRDRKAILNYFDSVSAELGKKGLLALLGGKDGAGLRQNPVTGLPEFIHSVFPNLDKLTPEQASQLKTRVQGGVGVAASIYGLSQAGGPVQGAMAGLGLMQGLNQLGFTAAGGPVGAAIGLIGGAILGASQAQREAEKVAQRLREQQLEQLRRIHNALLPMNDYFRRGLFGGLPSSMSFGGMNPEYSWSVQSRAGMQ